MLLRKRTGKLFIRTLCFLPLLLGCAVISESDSDLNFEENDATLQVFFGNAFEYEADDDLDFSAPPVKRRKLDNTSKKCKSSEETLAKKVLTKIESFGDSGCPSDEIKVFLRPSRCGPSAILETVVDAMLRKNVNIFYDEITQRYFYRGPVSPEQDPHLDLRLALVQHLSQNDMAEVNIGALGYAFFHKGYRTKSYRFFVKIYNAARFFCGDKETQSLLKVGKLLSIARSVPTASFAKVVSIFSSEETLHSEELALARYIFEIPQDVRCKMEGVRNVVRKRRWLSSYSPQ